MKHCQITGVEMPDAEKTARDEAANKYGEKFWNARKQAWDAAMIYRDAQANETDDIEYPPMWAIISESDKALWLRTRREVRAACRDAQHASDMSATCQLRDTSAEFPEAEFELWFNTPLPDRSCRTICEYWFEKGRASAEWRKEDMNNSEYLEDKRYHEDKADASTAHVIKISDTELARQASDSFHEGADWGFEKGRASDPGVANILLSLSKSNQYIADLEARFAEARAEIERLKASQ